MKVRLTRSHVQAKRSGLHALLQPVPQHLRNVSGTQHTPFGGQTNRAELFDIGEANCSREGSHKEVIANFTKRLGEVQQA